MTAIVVTAENLSVVKRDLRLFFPYVRSSHLTEALAAAVGHRTHAAMLSDLAHAEPAKPEVRLLDDDLFFARLRQLGCDLPEEDVEAGIYPPGVTIPEGVLIRTEAPSGHDIKYTSLRSRAWRNIAVAATNAAIGQGLFSVLDGDNHWPGCELGKSHLFEFIFADDIPALGCVRDIGWGEIVIHAALWPTDDARRWIRSNNAGFLAGEAFAITWLERRTGAYLQSNQRILRCRKARLQMVAGIEIRPSCFGDRGKVIL